MTWFTKPLKIAICDRAVAALWEAALGLPKGAVRTSARFFELGGHSLSAARVASRIGALFGVSLPVLLLFDHSLAELATARLPPALDRPLHPICAILTGVNPLYLLSGSILIRCYL